MFRKLTAVVALLLLLGSAQTLHAQITAPHTLADGETIDAARLNANFAMFADALNRTGGTLTGTLTTQQLTPSASNTYDLGVTGTRYRDLWLSRNATIAGSLTVVTGNTNGIGTSNVGTSVGLNIGHDATATGGFAEGVRISGNTTAAANSDVLTQLHVGLSGVAAKGAFTTLIYDVARFVGGTVTATGAGTISNASTIHVVSPPTIGTNNYAILVDSGTVFLNGSLIAGATTLSSASVTAALAVGTDLSVTGRVNSATAQPGFLAYNSSTDAGVTGTTTVDVDTEVYDEAGNFAGDTFTAPVTGRYLLCGAVELTPAASINVALKLVTSNRTYSLDADDLPNATTASIGNCAIADMDASDTALLQTVTAGTTSVIGAAAPNTYFSGRLMP